MLFKLENVSKSFGFLPVFSGINLCVQPGETISIIGPNGCGKTTLINIISGEIEPDSGIVEYSKNLETAVLKQVDIPQVPMGILEYVKEKAGYSDTAIDEISIDEYIDRELFDADTEIRKILGGFGFHSGDLDMPVSSLSKGQFRRVLFAVVLLKKSSLLLLDEPTNHLDIVAIEWLENYLRSIKKTVVFVSHDQDFIENAAERIVYIHDKSLYSFNGRYSVFKKHWEILRLERERQIDALQKTRQKLEDFISRNIAGQKTKQAQSRRKQLSRLQEADTIRDDRTYRFRFNNIDHNPPVICSFEKVSFGYGGESLIYNSSFAIHRDDRVGIVGSNGSGKTTLLNLITGRIKPRSGDVFLNRNIEYFFLNQESYSQYSGLSLTEVLRRYNPSMTNREIMDILGSYGFSQMASNRFGELSGGEKRRFQLAVSQIGVFNLLMLDEPTNHLDIFSIENLAEALLKYNGCCIFVTHNRYFLEKVAEKIIEIEEGLVTMYYGNYSYYKTKKALRALPVREEKYAVADRQTKKDGSPGISKNRLAQMQKRQRELEKSIEQCETERTNLIHQEFSNPDNYRDKLKYMTIKKQLDSLDRKIEELFDSLEEILAVLGED